MTWVAMGEAPLDLGRVLSDLAAPEDGALLLFLGTVRDHNDGRSVEGLEYEAYTEMGEEVLLAIAGEAGERFGTDRIGVYHRVGELSVGEVSTVIAVATPHREEAYGASRYIIEEIKKRLPVWKREKYVEGDSSWVKGHVPTPREEAGEGSGVSGRGGGSRDGAVRPPEGETRGTGAGPRPGQASGGGEG